MVFKPYKAYIIAGPNGAGKTTFARHLLAGLLLLDDFAAIQFVNADEIERSLISENPHLANANVAAGREMLRLIEAHHVERNNFMVETTLASKAYAQHIRQWSASGYYVELIYLRLPSVEASIGRVRRRVAAGGHGIPDDALRRRYQRSLDNLEQIYKPIVDEWSVYDSLEGEPKLVESGGCLHGKR